MSSAAIYGLYLNQSDAATDGYRASGDNAYIQVPMLSSNSMGYLYTALVRYSISGYSYVRFILNGQAGAWKQFAYTSDLPSKSSWNYDDRYVTALGTSGNNLTWTKNGTDNTITVPYASSAGSVEWGNITGKPSTFTPSTHVHDFLSSAGYGNWDANNMTKALGHFYGQGGGVSNIPDTYGTLITFFSQETTTESLSVQLYASINHNSESATRSLWFRVKNNLGWYDWKRVVDSSNYTDYTVTKTGSGASGTWGISITGNAATASSVAWSNVSGKPSEFTPASHNHDSTYLKLSGGTLTGALEVGGTIFGQQLRLYNSGSSASIVCEDLSSLYTQGRRAVLTLDPTSSGLNNIGIDGDYLSLEAWSNGNIEFICGSKPLNISGAPSVSIGYSWLGGQSSYKLGVNGSLNATTIYQNGTQVSVVGHTHPEYLTSLPSHDHDDKYAVWKRTNKRFDTNIPGGIYSVYNSASVSDVPGDVGLINIPTYSGHMEYYFYQTQIYFGTYDNTPKIRWVSKVSENSNPEASSWVSCYHSGNLVNLTNSEIDAIIV